MERFINTLQFLTRISIKKDSSFDEEFHKGIVYFPIIGLVIGLILTSFYHLMNYFLPSAMGIVLTVIVYIMITGGLHLDGLGDTFDGLYSNRPKERVLEIMKDSRLGTNALLAIVLVIIINIVALQNLDSGKLYRGLLLMPIMGRQALVLGCYRTNYAREEGMGNIYIGKVSKGQLWITLITTMILSIIDLKTLIFLPLMLIFVGWFKKTTARLIGGMTGDTLGALCELSQSLYLLFLVIQIN
ncbi:adenosylcobinamide-GDP ribazoletransferase [Alkaliphilus transvaalensis]|uniref:adenosylcobinamide-GDP ribazoletransferase n=1 Tax=Alkaliphilus transvaalensis TaxID=114628 RepID=UPI0004789C84|nr:adenosylcobinamide-GDP ribazoletransferase [Alkaliphilus transvaalensis]